MIYQAPTWNSLEITKLIVGALTPIALVFLGIWVNRIAKRVEAAEWANQKVIEKRIAIYDEVAPLLNDLYCYYLCVGNWKELIPTQIIEIKRKLDKRVFVYASLFSPEFMVRYDDFAHLCFRTFAGVGRDAILLTEIDHAVGGDRRTASMVPWKPEWDQLFSNEEECHPLREIRTAYEKLMFCFSEELGVGLRPSSSKQPD